jgi:hypothetical protein
MMCRGQRVVVVIERGYGEQRKSKSVCLCVPSSMQGHRDRCFIGIRGGAQIARQECAHRLELRLEATQQ